MVWFSAVMTRRLPRAVAVMVALSSGLITGTLMTAAATPFSASVRAAASAAGSIMPEATMQTSLPSPPVSTCALLKIEPVVVVEDHGNFAALEPQIDRARAVGDRRHHLRRLDGVGRLDHRHVGDRAHQRHILDRLVARTAGAGEAGHEADDLDVEVRIGDRHGDLVEAAARAEHAERIDEHDAAGAREPAGNAEHVRLRHADIDEAVGNFVAKQIGLGLAGQIGAETDDLRPPPRQLDQRGAVRLEHGLIRRLTQARPPVRA